jgi:hypothetical protein
MYDSPTYSCTVTILELFNSAVKAMAEATSSDVWLEPYLKLTKPSSDLWLEEFSKLTNPWPRPPALACS